jgi:thymidylate kinase
MTPKIYVVGFDGLHRSGKGTQINYLKEYLTASESPHVVIRGDGTRRGKGELSYDPKSTWWQFNYDYFFKPDSSPSETLYKRNLLYQRISREAQFWLRRGLPTIARDSSANRAFLVMDRTFLSRLFVMRQICPSISIDEALNSYNPNNSNIVESIIPDITFALDVSKTELLRRCESATDQPDKADFRRNNLLNHYGLYEKVLDEVCRDSRFNVCRVPGESSPEEIHSFVKKVVMEMK